MREPNTWALGSWTRPQGHCPSAFRPWSLSSSISGLHWPLARLEEKGSPTPSVKTGEVCPNGSGGQFQFRVDVGPGRDTGMLSLECQQA